MDFSGQSCIIGEAWDVRFDEKSISSKAYECMLTKKNCEMTSVMSLCWYHTSCLIIDIIMCKDQRENVQIIDNRLKQIICLFTKIVLDNKCSLYCRIVEKELKTMRNLMGMLGSRQNYNPCLTAKRK